MAKGTFVQTAFTAGELSGLLTARFGLELRQEGVKRLENFLVYPHGAAQIRPGLRYIRNTKDSSAVSRLIPFVYSSIQAYMLEFGDTYIRFCKDQAAITLTAQNITAITKADPAVVTYSGSDTYANADKVIITGVVGMAEVNNREFTVANVNVGANTFELSGIDSSDYTAYVSGGTVAEIYEISSPYAAADLAEIKYCQSADVLYLWHPDYAPRKLSRTGHTAWTLSTINFNPSATKEVGTNPDATCTPGATTGTGITFSFGDNVMLDGDVGRIIQSGAGRASITAYVAANDVTCDIIDDFASTDAIASGDWDLLGSPNDEVTPDISSPVGAIVTLTATTLNVFRAADVGKYIRINNGFIRITSYTSGTVVKGEILKVLNEEEEGTPDASILWTLEDSVWTAANGYPSCGTFFEDRLCVAGVAAYPETVWGSVVGDYENFTPGVDDSDSFEFSLGGRNVNVIRWLEPREYLVTGTIDSEYRLGPEDTGSPLTPLNVVAKQQTPHGGYNEMPVTVGAATLFIQKAQRKIREFIWRWEADRYVAPDMTRLSTHISKGGIKLLAYQQEPLSILWFIREDGLLLSMTYLREEDVVAWQRHPMDNGTVESVAVIPGTGYDEVWVIINRTIDGETVRYVEMLEEVFEDDKDEFSDNSGLNAFYVDSGLTYNGSETSTITGLWHLNGETVSILADGANQPQKTVSDGAITLDTAASVVHVGLPYTAEIETLRIEQLLETGISIAKPKRTCEVVVLVLNSKEFKIGKDSDNLDSPLMRNTDMPTGESIKLVSGNVRMTLDDAFRYEDRIVIVQDKPMPLTVLGIVQDVVVY